MHKLRRHEDVLAEYLSSDVLLIQESLQLAPTKLFPGFVIFDVPAVVTGGRNSGGLSVILRRATFGAADLAPVICEPHLLAVLIQWQTFTLLLASVYVPTSSTPGFFESLYAQLEALTDLYVPAAVIVAGDFNAHRFVPSSTLDHEFLNFIEYLRGDGFHCFPETEQPYTYMSGPSASTIDYVFYCGCASVNCKVDSDIAIAQHHPILVSFEIPSQPVERLEPSLGAAYWRSSAKQSGFSTGIGLMQPVYEVTSSEQLQGYYDRFCNFLQLSTKRTVRRREVPRWASLLSTEDKQALVDKEAVVSRLSRQASHGNSDDRRLLSEKKAELETLVTCLMRKALEAETDKLIDEATVHSSAWKVIANLRSTGPECPISTEALVRHFSEVSNPQNSNLLPAPLQPSPVSSMEPLVLEDVQTALRGVNVNLAPGPDGFTPKWMVSTFSSGVTFQFLFNLVAMCLVLAYVPAQWREATLFVLYKGSGDPCDPNNYRAIALTSSFGKLFERVLLQRLQLWFKNSRLCLLPQFGFRKASSCAHAIFLLRTLALDVLSCRRGPVFVAFVDLRKAFPSVGRDALFKRMIDLGIPYPLVAAVRSFYMGNKARLRVDNSLTRDFCVAIGVLEGSVLSPFLFGVLFSAIWDIFETTAFPTPAVRVYNSGSLWFIAYADDLAVITLSAGKLTAVLNKLATELKDFNLLVR
jgi:hypothetical protein